MCSDCMSPQIAFSFIVKKWGGGLQTHKLVAPLDVQKEGYVGDMSVVGSHNLVQRYEKSFK